MTQSTITLDVREDIRNGREPFAKITAAATRLEPGQDLLLIAPFEPVPMFHVLARQGFSHLARQNAAGDWEILFTRNVGQASRLPSPEAIDFTTSQKASSPRPSLPQVCGREGEENSAGQAGRLPYLETIELDARGLEPPQPMVNILEALAALPAGAQLRARTDRRPVHLYPMLAERGFIGQSEAEPEGGFITTIRRI